MSGMTQPNRMPIPGYRPKELVGIPWLCAFALRSSGWILRQEIIWNKSNVMPESVKDRCTRSHEHIFLFTKSRKYYFNAEAIKERTTGNAHDRGRGVHLKAKKLPNNWDTSLGEGGHDRFKKEGKNSRIHKLRDVQHANRTIHANRSLSAAVTKTVEFRNKRTVWTVATSPIKGGHYSTYPPKLIIPCILAGSRKDDIVLDPFFGSGTTGEVCEKLGRLYIGIELNREYASMIKSRTGQLGLHV